MEIMKVLVSTGVGGVIAALVIWWKMADDKRTMAREQVHAAELSAMYDRQEKVTKELIQVVQDNTEALSILAERMGAASEVANSRRQRPGR